MKEFSKDMKGHLVLFKFVEGHRRKYAVDDDLREYRVSEVSPSKKRIKIERYRPGYSGGWEDEGWIEASDIVDFEILDSE